MPKTGDVQELCAAIANELGQPLQDLQLYCVNTAKCEALADVIEDEQV